MALEQAPAFQFYPKDFLSSSKVIRMTPTERGIYITLLSVCWLEGGLPEDIKELAKLAGVPLKQFARLWPHNLQACFAMVKNGRLVNERLEAEREKQALFRQRQAANGKRRKTDILSDQNDRSGFSDHGVEKRAHESDHGDHAETRGKHVGIGSQAFANPQPTHSQAGARALEAGEIRRKEGVGARRSLPIGPPYDVWFEHFRKTYPVKGRTAGPMAMQAFLGVFETDLRDPAEIWSDIQASVSGYATSDAVRAGKVKNMNGWLTDGYYAQRHDAPVAPKDSGPRYVSADEHPVYGTGAKVPA